MFPEAAFIELLVLFSAGLVLVMVAGLNAMLGGRTLATRCSAAGIAVTVSSLIPLVFGPPEAAVTAVGLMVGTIVVLRIVGSARFSSLCVSVLGWIRRPVPRAILVGTAGVACMVVALLRFTAAEEQSMERDMDLMAEGSAQPPRVPVAGVSLTTDLGRPIPAFTPHGARPTAEIMAADRKLLAEQGLAERVIRTAPADDHCNCHGWVFTGGRYWVPGENVDDILADNGYQPVSDPRLGDLVIYRQGSTLAHTGVVRSAVLGLPVMLEGKWGWMGVFLHGVGDSFYGKNFQFYRSPRDGHVLAGVDGKAVENARAAVTIPVDR